MDKNLRIISALTAAIFLVTNSVFAQPAAPITPGTVGTSRLPIRGRIQIPEELGNLQAEYRDRENSRFVFVIQDAHAIIDAQNNIQKLIGFLQAKYGVPIVALEGGAGTLDPTLFKTFPDEFVKRKVLTEYLSRGELTGPDMAAIFNPGEAIYVGIEDWGLYEDNYLAYLRASQNRERILAKITEIKAAYDAERARVYSPELSAYHEKVSAFFDEMSALPDLLKYLSGFEIDAKQYPHLSALFESVTGDLSKKQDQIDMSIRQMAEAFKKKHLGKLDKKEQLEFNGFHQAYLSSQMDAGSFLKHLVETGRKHGLQPKLSFWMKELMGYTETLSSIKGTKLFDELLLFLKEVEGELVKKAEEKELAGRYERLRLLKDLAMLELTRKELQKYKEDPETYLSLLGEARQDMAPALDFYDAAVERDAAFQRNLARLFQKTKSPAAIVLAGGFHTEGFEENLKKGGYSYAVISPKILSMEGKDAYASVMDGRLSYKPYLKTTFYDAFVRHSSERMMNELNEPDFRKNLKLWRDAVIRKLAAEGRVAEAGEYTRYIDFLFKAYYDKFGAAGTPKSREEILKNIEKELDNFREDSISRLWNQFQIQFQDFTSGLRSLVEKKELNTRNVSALIDRVRGGGAPMALNQPGGVSVLISHPEHSVVPLQYGFQRSELRKYIETDKIEPATDIPTDIPVAGMDSYRAILSGFGAGTPATDNLVNRAEVRAIADTMAQNAGLVAENEIPGADSSAVAKALVPALKDSAARLGVTPPQVARAVERRLDEKSLVPSAEARLGGVLVTTGTFESTPPARAELRATDSEIEPLHVSIPYNNGTLDFVLNKTMMAMLHQAGIDPQQFIQEAIEGNRLPKKLQTLLPFLLNISTPQSKAVFVNTSYNQALANSMPKGVLKKLLFTNVWKAIDFEGRRQTKSSWLLSAKNFELEDYLLSSFTGDEFFEMAYGFLSQQEDFSLEGFKLSELLKNKLTAKEKVRFTVEQISRLRGLVYTGVLDLKSRANAYMVILFHNPGDDETRKKRGELDILMSEYKRLESKESNYWMERVVLKPNSSLTQEEIQTVDRLAKLDPNSKESKKKLADLKEAFEKQEKEKAARAAAVSRAAQFKNSPIDQIFSEVVTAALKADAYYGMELLRGLLGRNDLTLFHANAALSLLPAVVANYNEASSIYKEWTVRFRALLVERLLENAGSKLSDSQRSTLPSFYQTMFGNSSAERQDQIRHQPQLGDLDPAAFKMLEDSFFNLNQEMKLLNIELNLAFEEAKSGNLDAIKQFFAKPSTSRASDYGKAGFKDIESAKAYFRAVHGIILDIPFAEDTSLDKLPRSMGSAKAATLYSKNEISSLLEKLQLVDQWLSVLPQQTVLQSLSLQKFLIVKEMRAHYRHSELVQENIIALALEAWDLRSTLYHELGHSLHGPHGDFAAFIDSSRIRQIVSKHKEFFDSIGFSIPESDFSSSQAGSLIWKLIQSLYDKRLQEWKEFNRGIGVEDLKVPFKPDRALEIQNHYGISDFRSSGTPSLWMDYIFEIPLGDGFLGKFVREEPNELIAEYTQLYILYPKVFQKFDPVAFDIFDSILGEVHAASRAELRERQEKLTKTDEKFPGGVDIPENFPHQTSSNVLSLMEGDNRRPSVGVAEKDVTPFLADPLKSKPGKDTNNLGGFKGSEAQALSRKLLLLGDRRISTGEFLPGLSGKDGSLPLSSQGAGEGTLPAYGRPEVKEQMPQASHPHLSQLEPQTLSVASFSKPPNYSNTSTPVPPSQAPARAETRVSGQPTDTKSRPHEPVRAELRNFIEYEGLDENLREVLGLSEDIYEIVQAQVMKPSEEPGRKILSTLEFLAGLKTDYIMREIDSPDQLRRIVVQQAKDLEEIQPDLNNMAGTDVDIKQKVVDFYASFQRFHSAVARAETRVSGQPTVTESRPHEPVRAEVRHTTLPSVNGSKMPVTENRPYRMKVRRDKESIETDDTLEMVTTAGDFYQAHEILVKAYEKKGYSPSPIDDIFNQMNGTRTFVVREKGGRVKYALTVVLSAPAIGLPSGKEIEGIDMTRPNAVAEFSGLAMNPDLGDAESSIADLIQVFIAAFHYLKALPEDRRPVKAVITVNPDRKHAELYQRLFGFKTEGPVFNYHDNEKMPGQLLVLDLREVSGMNRDLTRFANRFIGRPDAMFAELETIASEWVRVPVDNQAIVKEALIEDLLYGYRRAKRLGDEKEMERLSGILESKLHAILVGRLEGKLGEQNRSKFRSNVEYEDLFQQNHLVFYAWIEEWAKSEDTFDDFVTELDKRIPGARTKLFIPVYRERTNQSRPQEDGPDFWGNVESRSSPTNGQSPDEEAAQLPRELVNRKIEAAIDALRLRLIEELELIEVDLISRIMKKRLLFQENGKRLGLRVIAKAEGISYEEARKLFNKYHKRIKDSPWLQFNETDIQILESIERLQMNGQRLKMNGQRLNRWAIAIEAKMGHSTVPKRERKNRVLAEFLKDILPLTTEEKILLGRSRAMESGALPTDAEIARRSGLSGKTVRERLKRDPELEARLSFLRPSKKERVENVLANLENRGGKITVNNIIQELGVSRRTLFYWRKADNALDQIIRERLGASSPARADGSTRSKNRAQPGKRGTSGKKGIRLSRESVNRKIAAAIDALRLRLIEELGLIEGDLISRIMKKKLLFLENGKGFSRADIAKAEGISERKVQALFNQNIEKFKNPQWLQFNETDIRILEAIERLQKKRQRLSRTAIAKEAGANYQTLEDREKENQVLAKFLKAILPPAPTTREKILRAMPGVRESDARPLSYSEIAERSGLNRNTVSEHVKKDPELQKTLARSETRADGKRPETNVSGTAKPLGAGGSEARPYAESGLRDQEQAETRSESRAGLQDVTPDEIRREWLQKSKVVNREFDVKDVIYYEEDKDKGIHAPGLNVQLQKKGTTEDPPHQVLISHDGNKVRGIIIDPVIRGERKLSKELLRVIIKWLIETRGFQEVSIGSINRPDSDGFFVELVGYFSENETGIAAQWSPEEGKIVFKSALKTGPASKFRFGLGTLVRVMVFASYVSAAIGIYTRYDFWRSFKVDGEWAMMAFISLVVFGVVPFFIMILFQGFQDAEDKKFLTGLNPKESNLKDFQKILRILETKGFVRQGEMENWVGGKVDLIEPTPVGKQALETLKGFLQVFAQQEDPTLRKSFAQELTRHIKSHPEQDEFLLPIIEEALAMEKKGPGTRAEMRINMEELRNRVAKFKTKVFQQLAPREISRRIYSTERIRGFNLTYRENDPLVNDLHELMQGILAISLPGELGKTLLNEVNREVIQPMRHTQHPWAMVLTDAEQWLAFQTMYFTLDEDYSVKTERLGHLASLETLSLRFALFGSHLRWSLGEGDGDDIRAMHKYFKRLAPVLMESEPSDLRRLISKRLLIGLALDKIPAGNLVEFFRKEIMGVDINESLAKQAVKNAFEDVFRDAPNLLPFVFFSELVTYENILQIIKYNQRHPDQQPISLTQVIDGKPEAMEFLRQTYKDAQKKFENNILRNLQSLAQYAGSDTKISDTRSETRVSGQPTDTKSGLRSRERAEARNEDEENPYASPSIEPTRRTVSELISALQETGPRKPSWIQRLSKPYRIREDFSESVIQRIQREFREGMSAEKYIELVNQSIKDWGLKYGLQLPDIPIHVPYTDPGNLSFAVVDYDMSARIELIDYGVESYVGAKVADLRKKGERVVTKSVLPIQNFQSLIARHIERNMALDRSETRADGKRPETNVSGTAKPLGAGGSEARPYAKSGLRSRKQSETPSTPFEPRTPRDSAGPSRSEARTVIIDTEGRFGVKADQDFPDEESKLNYVKEMLGLKLLYPSDQKPSSGKPKTEIYISDQYPGYVFKRPSGNKVDAITAAVNPDFRRIGKRLEQAGLGFGERHIYLKAKNAEWEGLEFYSQKSGDPLPRVLKNKNNLDQTHQIRESEVIHFLQLIEAGFFNADTRSDNLVFAKGPHGKRPYLIDTEHTVKIPENRKDIETLLENRDPFGSKTLHLKNLEHFLSMVAYSGRSSGDSQKPEEAKRFEDMAYFREVIFGPDIKWEPITSAFSRVGDEYSKIPKEKRNLKDYVTALENEFKASGIQALYERLLNRMVDLMVPDSPLLAQILSDLHAARTSRRRAEVRERQEWTTNEFNNGEPWIDLMNQSLNKDGRLPWDSKTLNAFIKSFLLDSTSRHRLGFSIGEDLDKVEPGFFDKVRFREIPQEGLQRIVSRLVEVWPERSTGVADDPYFWISQATNTGDFFEENDARLRLLEDFLPVLFYDVLSLASHIQILHGPAEISAGHAKLDNEVLAQQIPAFVTAFLKDTNARFVEGGVPRQKGRGLPIPNRILYLYALAAALNPAVWPDAESIAKNRIEEGQTREKVIKDLAELPQSEKIADLLEEILNIDWPYYGLRNPWANVPNIVGSRLVIDGLGENPVIPVYVWGLRDRLSGPKYRKVKLKGGALNNPFLWPLEAGPLARFNPLDWIPGMEFRRSLQQDISALRSPRAEVRAKDSGEGINPYESPREDDPIDALRFQGSEIQTRLDMHLTSQFRRKGKKGYVGKPVAEFIDSFVASLKDWGKKNGLDLSGLTADSIKLREGNPLKKGIGDFFGTPIYVENPDNIVALYKVQEDGSRVITAIPRFYVSTIHLIANRLVDFIESKPPARSETRLPVVETNGMAKIDNMLSELHQYWSQGLHRRVQEEYEERGFAANNDALVQNMDEILRQEASEDPLSQTYLSDIQAVPGLVAFQPYIVSIQNALLGIGMANGYIQNHMPQLKDLLSNGSYPESLEQVFIELAQNNLSHLEQSRGTLFVYRFDGGDFINLVFFYGGADPNVISRIHDSILSGNFESGHGGTRTHFFSNLGVPVILGDLKGNIVIEENGTRTEYFATNPVRQFLLTVSKDSPAWLRKIVLPQVRKSPSAVGVSTEDQLKVTLKIPKKSLKMDRRIETTPLETPARAEMRAKQEKKQLLDRYQREMKKRGLGFKKKLGTGHFGDAYLFEGQIGDRAVQEVLKIAGGAFDMSDPVSANLARSALAHEVLIDKYARGKQAGKLMPKIVRVFDRKKTKEGETVGAISMQRVYGHTYRKLYETKDDFTRAVLVAQFPNKFIEMLRALESADLYLADFNPENILLRVDKKKNALELKIIDRGFIIQKSKKIAYDNLGRTAIRGFKAVTGKKPSPKILAEIKTIYSRAATRAKTKIDELAQYLIENALPGEPYEGGSKEYGNYPRSRQDAARELGNIGDGAKEAVEALIVTLQDRVGFVRLEAIRALVKINPKDPRLQKETMDGLSRILGDPRYSTVGWMAAKAMWKINEREAASRLAKIALEGPEETARYFSRTVLSDRGLKNKDPEIRRIAEETLQELAKRDATRAEARTELPTLSGTTVEELRTAWLEGKGNEIVKERVQITGVSETPRGKEVLPALNISLGIRNQSGESSKYTVRMTAIGREVYPILLEPPSTGDDVLSGELLRVILGWLKARNYTKAGFATTNRGSKDFFELLIKNWKEEGIIGEKSKSRLKLDFVIFDLVQDQYVRDRSETRKSAGENRAELRETGSDEISFAEMFEEAADRKLLARFIPAEQFEKLEAILGSERPVSEKISRLSQWEKDTEKIAKAKVEAEMQTIRDESDAEEFIKLAARLADGNVEKILTERFRPLIEQGIVEIESIQWLTSKVYEILSGSFRTARDEVFPVAFSSPIDLAKVHSVTERLVSLSNQLGGDSSMIVLLPEQSDSQGDVRTAVDQAGISNLTLMLPDGERLPGNVWRRRPFRSVSYLPDKLEDAIRKIEEKADLYREKTGFVVARTVPGFDTYSGSLPTVVSDLDRVPQELRLPLSLFSLVLAKILNVKADEIKDSAKALALLEPYLRSSELRDLLDTLKFGGVANRVFVDIDRFVSLFAAQSAVKSAA